MGQSQAFQFLKERKGKWFTSKEVRELCSECSNVTEACFRKLRLLDDIEFRRLGNNGFEYRYIKGYKNKEAVRLGYDYNGPSK